MEQLQVFNNIFSFKCYIYILKAPKTVSSNYVTYQYISMCNLVSVDHRYVKLVKMFTVALSTIVNV